VFFWPLLQDFYIKSRHASPPQNSSQIYAYDRQGRIYMLNMPKSASDYRWVPHRSRVVELWDGVDEWGSVTYKNSFLVRPLLRVWQPRRAADMSTNWRQSLFCCCTASMEQATDGAETAAIDGLVSSWSENIFVSFCLREPRYGLTLWCTIGLLVGGAIQVPQLQLLIIGIGQHYTVVDIGPTQNEARVTAAEIAGFIHAVHCLLHVRPDEWKQLSVGCNARCWELQQLAPTVALLRWLWQNECSNHGWLADETPTTFSV